jgi:membrane-associated protease RseP (regulator of RpoE activity)
MTILIFKGRAVSFITCAVLLTGSAIVRADQDETNIIVTTQTAEAESPGASSSSSTAVATAQSPGDDEGSSPHSNQRIIIQSIEPDGHAKQMREVAWLGLAVEDATEVLSSQLGLKTGEGLTVNMVAKGSPAAEAGFQVNDVLTELDGQMLVEPKQFRKLVQMHAQGDKVKLTFYRHGKKQDTTVSLGKTMWGEVSEAGEGLPSMDSAGFHFQFNGLNSELHGLHESLARAGFDKDKMNIEIRRTMEQTRKAIQDAVQNAVKQKTSLISVTRELDKLARDGVDVDNDATITVRNTGKSSRTIVQTDETGVYILEAGAKTHLIVRDKDGRTVFDGSVDTPAQRKGIPKKVWDKVQPMFDQIGAPNATVPKGDDKHDDGEKKPTSRNNMLAHEFYRFL